MPRVTAEERALARAALYRVLSAAFSYPEPQAAAPGDALPAALVGAAVLSDEVETATAEADAAFGAASPAALEAAYQRAFTLSYSEDCPMYETAFSARHLFQQTRQLADLSGFYRAFGVATHHDRPDHIAVELEFGYLLALKEAAARAAGESDRLATCRAAQRSFVRDHLARWAPLFAGRAELAGAETPYAAAARLLRAFVAYEERFLRLGEVDRHRDEPAAPQDAPGDMSCPLAEAAMESLIDSLPEQGEEIRHGTLAPT